MPTPPDCDRSLGWMLIYALDLLGWDVSVTRAPGEEDRIRITCKARDVELWREGESVAEAAPLVFRECLFLSRRDRRPIAA